MLRIQRANENGLVTFALSGRIEYENVHQLKNLLDSEFEFSCITFDLNELRLVDRDAVRSLAGFEAKGVKLTNCPPYIRGWIDSGSDAIS